MSEFNRLLSVLSFRATVSSDLRRMLDWKLLPGSHEFPGPDGGTCVNEAAIVAAGYPYRAIHCVEDLPNSFSRPIAMVALCLNDTLADDLRQELLLPFITRLAGSANAPKIEMTRAEFMLKRTLAEILAPALARAGYVDLAERCCEYRTPNDLVEIARHLGDCAGSALPRPLLAAFEHAADAGRQWLWGLPNDVAFHTFCAIRAIASLNGGRFEERVYRRSAAILEAAIAIGNHAETNSVDVVVKRIDAAKSAVDGPLVAA